MKITYLAKIGELSLKGGNKKFFEDCLIHNFHILSRLSNISVKILSGRMYVECEENDKKCVENALSHLIGITGWAKTEVAEKNIEDISLVIMQEAKKARREGAKTFKIETRREDKTFPLNSNQISCDVGGLIHTSGILKTDLHKPDRIINIEIRKKAFIYSFAHKGIQGLPVGSSGKALLLLSGGIDSPLAGYKMLTRGMKIDFLYFHSYPFTSDDAKNKVEKLASLLSKYEDKAYLNIVSFTKIQARIKEATPQSYLTLMMRVCMMIIATIIAKKIDAKTIITGESLSQVASQTIENISVVDSYASLPVMRPLIGMNKEEIIKEAINIGTYPISIIPYPDCCSLFSPKHPILYGEKEKVDNIYKAMGIEKLLEEAIKEREIKRLLPKNS